MVCVCIECGRTVCYGVCVYRVWCTVCYGVCIECGRTVCYGVYVECGRTVCYGVCI